MPASLTQATIRIVSLEHAALEGAGKIADWARRRGHTLTAVRLDRGDALPALSEFDLLVIMGGGMNVYQYRDYPWLRDERELILSAIHAQKAVFGVCLGAQLIADALGARVFQNAEKEIGWFPVRFTGRHPFIAAFPEECIVFHWHGDTFALPEGAVRLAVSDVCENQAFLYGDRVVGLQFHVEVAPEKVREWTVGAESVLEPARYVQSAEELASSRPDLSATDRGLEKLLDGLAEHAVCR